MPYFEWIWGAFGLVIGSFLNVCIHRLPRRESVVFPHSHCPQCNAPIRPYDNIPVLSYLLLAGRCRKCKTAISPQYPAVELLAGLSFFGCALHWEATTPAFVNSLFVALAIVLVFIDYQHQILPNVLTLPGTAAGFLLSPWQDPAYYGDPLSRSFASLIWPGDASGALPWAGSLAGALVGSGLLFAVAYLYELLRKRQGLGMGDVKMMAMVGAFLGWRLALVTIFAGSFLGSVAGIFLVLFSGRTMQSKLAFGTFLGAAAVLALFAGLPLVDWYTAAR